MQRFLQVFTFLSLITLSYQSFGQTDLQLVVFEDINGDGSDEGITIGGLAADLTLFEDTDGSGTGDVGEELAIVATEGAVGVYTFAGIVVGANDFIVGLADQSPTYYVTVVPPLAPLGFDNDNDLDINSWQTASFTLIDGVNENRVDIGLVVPASIGDLVWEDFDGNGTFDGPDAGFDWVGAGININLTSASGNANDLLGNPFAAIDLGAGGYEFENLPPDTYTVEFTQIVNNWYRTIDGFDSTPDQATGFAASFLLESGMMNVDQDAGYVQPSIISDFVWEDLNGDGIQDGGEPGVDITGEGITIEVTLIGGAAATDLDGNSPPLLLDNGGGNYEIRNLAPGDYEVIFGEVPMLWYLSLQNAAGVDLDSDPDPTSGIADNGGVGYNLMSGDINEDIDAGYLQPARISDFVWEDENGDGIQDAGEPGVDGVDVMITTALGGGVTDLEGAAVITSTSAGGGLYEFLLLPPGDYILTVNTNVLTDYYLSLQDAAGGAGDAADVGNDSDADQMTGESHVIEIESDEQQEDIDFGYFRSGIIEGIVFHDSDGNGENGTNADAPFAGMTVQLATAAGVTPVPDVFGVNIPDQVSDGAGMVTFMDVPPGEYILLFQLPGGWEFTYQDQSGFSTDADDVDNDSDAAMGGGSPGQTHTILLEGGETNSTSSAGIYKLMSLGDFVWIDDNGGDGTFDGTEAGGINVIIRLFYDADFDGTAETTVGDMVTDMSGNYLFEDLIPGFYQVVIPSSNFGGGGALEYFQNCSGGGDPFTDNDNDGNGDALLMQDIESITIELFCDEVSDLPGPDENLFIDFCFFFDCNASTAPDLSWQNCQTADDNPPICNLNLLDNYCGSMNVATSTGDQPNPLCQNSNNNGGVPHNSSWFAFVAGEAGFQMEVVPFNCTDAGGFTGIQAGVYTDCTWAEAVFCQSNCSTGPITIGGAGTELVPGETYYFFLDGCAGSVCDYEVNVIQGGVQFTIPNPTGLACSIPDCGPVCPDSEIIFTVEGLDIEIDYHWIIPDDAILMGDGEQTGNEVITNTNEIILVFPEEGIFTVFLDYATNECNVTTGAMVDVEVVVPDPEDFGEFTVCEHNLPFNEGDTDINGNTLVGWNGDPNILNGPLTDFTITYADPSGCMIEQIIDIIQIDNSPREDVNIAICESDLPYTYDQLTVTGNGAGGFNNFIYTLVDTPAASGCDSFITLTTVVLEHELELDAECLLGGVQIRINDEVMVPMIPNDVNYQWYQDDNMNDMYDPGEESNDTDGFSDILQIEESGTYCVDVTLNHFIGESGEASCVFTYCEEVIIEELAPPLSIEDNWLISPCNASGNVTYVVTNPDPTVEYYNWSIQNGGGSFIGETGQFDPDGMVEIDWSTGSGGMLCVFAHNSCGDGPELCIEISPIDAPEVTFDLIEEECQDSIVTITFMGDVSATSTYAWDFGNGVTETTEGPHDVTYATPGLYYVTLTVDDNGCISDEVLDSILIIERLPAPVFTCMSTPTSITLTWLEVPGATGYEVTLLDGVAGVFIPPSTYEATGVTVNDFFEISVVATTDGACTLGNPGTASCFAQDCDEPIFTFTPTRDTICLTTDVGLDTIYLDIMGGTTPNTNLFTGPGIINGAEGVFDADDAGVGMHTITYNYTGDDNCMFSRSIIMHVFEQPIAAFTTNVDTICIADAFTVEYTGGTTGANYMWDFGDGVDMTGTGVGPFDITYSSVGMKTITLTVVKEECTSETITKEVWVEAELPELVIDCVTDATSINYSWNDIADSYEVFIDAASQGLQSDPFWNIPGLTPGTAVSIEVIAISPNQCPNSAATRECSATNCPDMSVSIDQPDELLCIDSSTTPINLTYTVTGGFMDGSGIAEWSGNGVDPVTGVFTPSDAGEGPQVITLNYSEGECNASPVNVVFTVVNQPTASFDGVSTVCEGTEITLNHTGIAGTGATYTWTIDGATVVGPSDQSSITLRYDNSGMYDITLVVSRSGCDSEPVTQSITIDEMLLPPAIICFEPESTLINFQWGAVDGATNYDIFIDNVPQGQQTGTSFQITGLSPNDERTITVIALSDNACPNSTMMRPCQAIDCPLTQIVPDDDVLTFCEGDMINHDIDFVINGGFNDNSGVMTFNGPSTDPVTGVVDVQSLNPGNYTVYLDYTEGPCDTRDSVLITVVDLPVPTLDFEPVICVTDSLTITYTGDDVPGAIVTLVPTGNPMTLGGLPNETIYQWATDGTFEIVANVMVGTCMVSSETYTVVVEPELLDPVITCNPTTTSIDISWDAVDCASMYIVTVDAVAQPAQSETTFSITDLEPETSVDITVEAISDCACNNSMVSDVCMTSPCTPITIDIINNIPDCITNLPLSIQLDVTLSGGVGGGTGSWTGDFISTDGLFDYESSGVGLHEVTYTYQENGCEYDITETVDVFDPPGLTVVPIDLTCFDSDDGSIAFEVTGGDGVYDIVVSMSGVEIETFTSDDMVLDLTPGSYEISVEDGNGCADSQTVVISAPGEPSFSVTGPPSIVVGAFGDLALDLGTVNVDDITNLTWYSETETLCDGPDCFDLIVSPSVNSLYCVDITLEGGCVVSSCLPIVSEFITIINVSNVFSANGDGTNDNFVIQTNNPDLVASYLRVFDRWGNLVFNVEAPWKPYDDMNYPGWDGTYKGQELNPGVYVYVFEFIEEPGATPEVRVGDVTIVK